MLCDAQMEQGETVSVHANETDADVISGQADTAEDSGQTVPTVKTPKEQAYELMSTKIHERVLSCSSDRTLRVWDVATGKEVLVIEGAHDDWVSLYVNIKSSLTSLSPRSVVWYWELL